MQAVMSTVSTVVAENLINWLVVTVLVYDRTYLSTVLNLQYVVYVVSLRK